MPIKLSPQVSPETSKPTLFGLGGKTNRETGKKTHWGKNEFNSSFPTALLCYMAARKTRPVFLKLNKDLKIEHDSISVSRLFSKNPLSKDIYFSFEDSFTPYREFVRGQLPRNDLVILDISKNSEPLKGFEVKLTALPDNSTAKFGENRYSCEMVFRPPSIVHLAMSIAYAYKDKKSDLLGILSPVCSRIFNWRNAEEIVGLTDELVRGLDLAFLELLKQQEPFVLQPIWKTRGKATVLHDDCLDVFVWSNFAFTRLFVDLYKGGDDDGSPKKKTRMTRPQRCIFWLARMLYDFAQIGKMNPSLITNEMGYQLQTDKAFSISGIRSWKFLRSNVLLKPRIRKTEIRKIILNGGQNQLSPERRFDAAIVNTPGIFA
jgi:hypothetical protein